MPYKAGSEKAKISGIERSQRWRENHPEKVRAQQLLYNERRRYKWANDPRYRALLDSRRPSPEIDAADQKRRRDERKKLVFDHYGRECKCCGEKIQLFLTIDHINTDGAAHRRTLSKHVRGAGSGAVYLWLVSHNFPEGFQTLCQNCNSGRYRNGGICPHKAPLGQS